jgi:hypothetical protein
LKPRPTHSPSLPHSHTHRAHVLAPRCAHTGEDATTVRLGPSLFRGRRRVLAVIVASVSFVSTSTTRDTPRFAPPPLFLSARTHRSSSAQPLSNRALVVPLPTFKDLGIFPRRNQPSPTPNFPFPALGGARLLVGVESHRHRATSSWIATLQRPCTGAVPTPAFATFP